MQQMPPICALSLSLNVLMHCTQATSESGHFNVGICLMRWYLAFLGAPDFERGIQRGADHAVAVGRQLNRPTQVRQHTKGVAVWNMQTKRFEQPTLTQVTVSRWPLRLAVVRLHSSVSQS